MNERDRLRGIFHEMHQADPVAPEYRSLAARPSRPARPPIVARAAWAAAAVVAAGVLILAVRAPNPPDEDATLRLAASLGAWEAPTDFLLVTPGAGFLESAPRLGNGAGLSGDPADLLQNDPNDNDMDDFNVMEVLE